MCYPHKAVTAFHIFPHKINTRVLILVWLQNLNSAIQIQIQVPGLTQPVNRITSTTEAVVVF